MPLQAATMKAKFKDTIVKGLKREFAGDASKGEGYSAEAEANWLKMANAISDIAIDLVNEIHANATVAPGQSIVGVGGGVPGPVSGTTVSPGKIL